MIFVDKKTFEVGTLLLKLVMDMVVVQRNVPSTNQIVVVCRDMEWKRPRNRSAKNFLTFNECS